MGGATEGSRTAPGPTWRRAAFVGLCASLVAVIGAAAALQLGVRGASRAGVSEPWPGGGWVARPMPGAGQGGQAGQGGSPVTPRPVLALRVTPAVVRGTGCVRVQVAAPAGHRGRTVTLQRHVGSGWSRVGGFRLATGSVGAGEICLPWDGARAVQLRARPTWGDAIGASRAVRLRVVRPWWARRVRSIVHRRSVSVSVALGDRFLFRHRDTLARIPASNEKLLLSMALLDRLGAWERLPTKLVARPSHGKVVRGAVWLVGGGDPWLDRRDLHRLAVSVRRSGVRRITGRVVGSRGAGSGQARALAEELRRAGVAVRLRPRMGRPPRRVETLAVVRSARVGALLRPVLVHSLNGEAEVLGKRLGAEVFASRRVSRAAGAMAIREFAAERGVWVRALDASGLAWGNRVTAAGIVRLLSEADREPWGRALRGSLPRPGQGTLWHRLRGLKVRAKTGTLGSDVSALSGYVWLDRRNTWARFSILSRGMSKTRAVRMEDRIVRTLARHAR